MSTVINISLPDRRNSVEWDLHHVDILVNAVARKARREIAGSTFGLALDEQRVKTAVTAQIIGLVKLASSGSKPVNMQEFDLIEYLVPLMREVFPAKRTSGGNTVKLSLKKHTPLAIEAIPSNEVVQEDGVQSVVTEDIAAVMARSFHEWEVINEAGLASGMKVTSFDPSVGGSFDALSATAEWTGDSCVVYHEGALTPAALSVVAALNIQGISRQIYGSKPEVQNTLVVKDATLLYRV